jgi:ATP-dependent Lon protease
LEVIEIPSYTSLEKLRIARHHLVPRQLKEHGLKSSLVRFPAATIQRVIQDYTRESGVRQLDREIASLSRKAARQLASQPEGGPAIVFKPEQLSGYLGPPKFVSHDAEKITGPGIAIGLAWTPVGGEILFIEATRMPGKGALILTGSLGEVMKESAQAALSFLRSHAQSLDIDLTDFEKKDIHIHVPAGATPKDGPSAGVTIASALASLLTGRLVRSNMAMTGEISLRGRVLSVGGIKEKVLAAARSGLREVILPADNKNDWLEVPEEVRRRFKAHFVHSVADLFKLAFEPVQKPIPRKAAGILAVGKAREAPVAPSLRAVARSMKAEARNATADLPLHATKCGVGSMLEESVRNEQRGGSQKSFLPGPLA